MKLQFTAQTTIKDLNSTFQRRFPYLKLAFYNPRDFPGHAELPVDENSILLNIKGVLIEGELDIFDNFTAGELEAVVNKRFCVSMKVLRRLKHSWADVENQRHLTLEALNHQGEVSYFEVPEYYIM